MVRLPPSVTFCWLPSCHETVTVAASVSTFSVVMMAPPAPTARRAKGEEVAMPTLPLAGIVKMLVRVPPVASVEVPMERRLLVESCASMVKRLLALETPRVEVPIPKRFSTKRLPWPEGAAEGQPLVEMEPPVQTQRLSLLR